MVIDWIPEFDAVIENHLISVADELKRLEISRRLVAASGIQNEKEKNEILNYSTAFAYVIHVEGGTVSVERIPEWEDNEMVNECIIETNTISQTVLPEQIQIAAGNAPELTELLIPQISELITNEVQNIIGGVS